MGAAQRISATIGVTWVLIKVLDTSLLTIQQISQQPFVPGGKIAGPNVCLLVLWFDVPVNNYGHVETVCLFYFIKQATEKHHLKLKVNYLLMRSHVFSLCPDSHFAHEQFRNCTAQSKTFNSLLKSRFGVHHHITYMYIYRHIKIHQTILYRIIRDYIHLKIHKNYHSWTKYNNKKKGSVKFSKRKPNAIEITYYLQVTQNWQQESCHVIGKYPHLQTTPTPGDSTCAIHSFPNVLLSKLYNYNATVCMLSA